MKKAVITFNLLVVAFCSFAQNHILLGNQHYVAGKYKEAVDEYLQARFTSNSTNAELYFNIGMAKRQLSLYPEAISYLTTAIEMKPDNKGAWYERGRVKEETGDHPGAIYDYTKALSISEQYQDARFERGYSRTSAGDYAAAIADFTYYLNQGGPHYANAYYERAVAKNLTLQYSSALEDLEKASELGLKDKHVYFETAFSYEGLGEYLKATDIYTKIIQSDASYANAYYRRSSCYQSLNRKDEACKDLHKAYDLGLKSVKEEMDKICK